MPRVTAFPAHEVEGASTLGALAQDLIELVHALRDASFRSMVHAPLILLGHLLVGYGSAYCCTAYLVPLEVRPWISTVLFALCTS